jgi:hypothetical protein
VTVPITLSAASAVPVTVTVTTSNGTATAGSDYTATTQTITFAPGVTSQPVSVVVVGDTSKEADETVVLTLSGAQNATIGTATGALTLRNDD